MATLSWNLASIFSAINPFKKSHTVCRVKKSSLQAVPLPTGEVQYTSARPMRAIPPSEVKPKAVLATTTPSETPDAMTEEVPVGDLEAKHKKTTILDMRGGLEHDNHGTGICHDVCGCFICCDFMDYCCTAIDDVICCE